MPKRTDIHTILIVGAGPIVIGQACEFDYSGVQACKALRAEGYRVVLINSNPATIMTDPDMADATYVEPLTPEMVEQVIRRERPDALLPTVGGQTALNLAVALAEGGVLERYGVQLIGASLDAIRLAEDRQRFKDTMARIGLETPLGVVAERLDEALALAGQVGYPLLVRPSFTLGGSGGGIAYTPDELAAAVEHGCRLSPVGQVLVEQSVLGWKEFELEVMRDRADNFVVVCSIENLDPMGVHTGDSITVAPAQTLTDKEYQRLRDAARAILTAVGVETGGSNVQFAVHPDTGRVVVIEMNPRVSRSSALASKATGFPIAKIAALLAVGYTLDEIPNDITRVTPASFEPSIDYVVVKLPRWDFKKFPGVDPTLGPQMKSVGEVMAIGRTFKEALGKGVRGLEIGRAGLGPVPSLSNAPPQSPPSERGGGEEATPSPVLTGEGWGGGDPVASGLSPSAPPQSPSQPGASRDRPAAGGEGLGERLSRPTPGRLFDAYAALRQGATVEEVAAATAYDPWFVDQLAQMAEIEAALGEHTLATLPAGLLRAAKRAGFSDAWIAQVLMAESHPHPNPLPQREREIRPPSPGGRGAGGEGEASGEGQVRALRRQHAILPVYQRVDTCAAEFEAHTPYLYSAYETASEAQPTGRPKVMILGGGPNRIGQGLEFDYCCVQACFALKELGFETIMVNCNPETVSTDYDTADRLYFEPLTLEDVLNVWEAESGGEPVPVIVQFGGQTPLNLAEGLAAAGVPIWGTSPQSIAMAEDRGQFEAVLAELDIPRPPNGIAAGLAEAREIARRIGYPVLVRPSFVLGGRAMAVVYDEESLAGYLVEAEQAAPGKPILIDHYLEDSYEIDVDAVGDRERLVIGGIMQHIEEAGVHSGDSACVLPPYKISAYHLSIIREYTERLGQALGVRGLMNVQYAIKEDIVYVLEVNPRASRTVPYVSKATGVPLARIAAQVMAGRSLVELGLTDTPPVDGFFVKEAVLPFRKFPGVDAALGPEMHSTGEVMGHAPRFGMAFAKAEAAADNRLPAGGTVFISVNDFDKGAVLKIGRDLARLGFKLMATHGTAAMLRKVGISVQSINKVSEGSPHIVDALRAGQVDLIINTPLGRAAFSDGRQIRQEATRLGIPLLTTLSAAQAAVNGIHAMREEELTVRSLQDYHRKH
jgi:carbamoyl-phosphate synthase large subunit